MQIFSVREDAKLKRNLLDLISTWLRSRYYINELSQQSVKARFEVIFQYFGTIPDEGIRGEFEILKVLHKNSQSITPRERISLSIASFDAFIKELQYIKKSDDFQRWYKTLVHEITSFFMSYLVNIPTDEYFLKFTSNAPSQHFSEFFEAVNKLESFLKSKFTSFTGHDAVRYYEALINAITIANEERLYQTAFTLKHVLDSFTTRVIPLAKTKKIDTQLKAINSLFKVDRNFQCLRDKYQFNDIHTKGYFPLLSLVNKDLTVFAEILPETVRSMQGVSYYNIQRMNLIFKTLHPLLMFSHLSGVYIPKTNLQIMIAHEPLQEGSSSSNAQGPRASRSQSLPHTDRPKY